MDKGGTVRQISVANEPATPYFLRVDWAVDLGAGFTLALSDGSSAWIGEVSEDEVTKRAEELGVEREAYVEELLQALTGGEGGVRGGGAEKGAYSFHLSPDHSCLSYKKSCNGDLVHMGSADLQADPDPLEVVRELIGHTLERSADLESGNRKLLEENQWLRHKHQHVLQELEKHVQDKEATERALYSRFVSLLKEKKSKIRSLQEVVHHLQQPEEQEMDEELPESPSRGRSPTENRGRSTWGSPQSVTPSQAPTVLLQERSMGLSMADSMPDFDDAESHRVQSPELSGDM